MYRWCTIPSARLGYREKESPNFSCCALTTISWACHVPTPLLPSLSSMVNHYNQFLAHIFPLLSPTSSYLFIWQNLILVKSYSACTHRAECGCRKWHLKFTTPWPQVDPRGYPVIILHFQGPSLPSLPPTTSYLLSAPSNTPSPVLSVGDLAS